MSLLQSFLLVVNLVVGLLIVVLVLFSSMGGDGILAQGGEKFLPGSVDSFRNKFIAILVAIFVINVLAIGALSIDRKTIAKINHDKRLVEEEDL